VHLPVPCCYGWWDLRILAGRQLRGSLLLVVTLLLLLGGGRLGVVFSVLLLVLT
jgi:hypothetical protein